MDMVDAAGPRLPGRTSLARPIQFLLLLAVSFVIFVAPFTVSQALQWTDPGEGWPVGLIVFGLVWCVVVFPVSLLIYLVFCWRRWVRFRAVAILAPGVILSLHALTVLRFERPDPAEHLLLYTNAHLPASARDLRVHFTGGLIADHHDTYCFRCSRSDTDRLIAELKLTSCNVKYWGDLSKMGFPGWPNPEEWVGGAAYEGSSSDETWFYRLFVDASHEQVYLVVFCI